MQTDNFQHKYSSVGFNLTYLNLRLYLFSPTLKILVPEKNYPKYTSIIYLFSFHCHLLEFQYNFLSGSSKGEVSGSIMLVNISPLLIKWWEKFKRLIFKQLTHLTFKTIL